MKRLQLDLQQQFTIEQAKLQAQDQGWTLTANDLRGIALEVRDDLGLKKCIRVCNEMFGKTDTFIFTEL